MNENKIRNAFNQLVEAAKAVTEAVDILDDEGICVCDPFSNYPNRLVTAIQVNQSIEKLADILGVTCGEFGGGRLNKYLYFHYDGVEIKEITEVMNK
jgi:hypothetical protein